MNNILDTKQLNTAFFLLSAAVNGTVAFCLYSDNPVFFLILNYLFMSLFIYNAAKSLVFILTKNKKLFEGITQAVLNCSMFLLLRFCPEIYLRLFNLLFAGYLLILAFVNFVSAYLYNKNKAGRVILTAAYGLVILILAGLIVFEKAQSPQRVYKILTLYFAFSAFTDLIDFIEQILPEKLMEKIRQQNRNKISAVIDSISGAFAPSKFLKQLKELIKKHPEKLKDKLSVQKSELKPDAEVFFHVADTLTGRFGHTDICFEGTVYTFGNYDESSYRFFGIVGDGVFETAPRDLYIQFCRNYAKKNIVSYGIKLTQNGRKRLSEAIENIKNNTYPWSSPLEAAEKINEKTDAAKYTDFASAVYKSVRSSFYKFKSGRFKSFFGLNTNCVRFTDYLMSASGLDTVKPFGILTPGMYYEFLNRELKKNRSQVISRLIYTAKQMN